MNEVARQADVSPTKVANHFPTQESLIEAVVDRVLADIQVPDSTIFAGVRSLRAGYGY
jgi:AcrR family transcriptional regulator